MPNAVVEHVYRLLGSSQTGWWLLQLLVSAGLVGLVAVRDRRCPGPREGWGMFVLFAAHTAVMWLPNYPRPELNPDEGQWIAQANDLVREPVFWVRHFLVGNWSRVLTILPLAAGGMLAGGGIGYSGARLVAAFLWAAFSASHFVAVREVFGRRAALWSSTLVALVIGLFSLDDFVAYNSELPVIVLCMGATALLARAATGARGGGSAFAAGVLVAAVPFAKDQGLPIAAVLGCGGLVLLWRRQPRLAASLVTGGAVCWLLLPLILLLAGGHEEWLFMLRSSGEYWRHGTRFALAGGANRWRIAKSMFLQPELRLLLYGTLLGCPFLLRSWWSARWRPDRLQLAFTAWAAALLGAAIFAVVFPAQRFPHYGILLVFPCSMLLAALVACLLLRTGADPWQVASICWLLLLFPLCHFDGHDGVRALADCLPQRGENLFSARIRGLAQPGDRLLTWAWRNSYFVETGLLQGSRCLHPMGVVDRYPSRADYLRRYAEDIDNLRPAFIIEWVGNDSFYFRGERAVRITDIPELSPRVENDYELIAEEGNQRLFGRKPRARGGTGWSRPPGPGDPRDRLGEPVDLGVGVVEGE